jgi:outer membrane protein assembly factor BamB
MTEIPRRLVLKAAGTAAGTALLTTGSFSALAQTSADSSDASASNTAGWPMRRGTPAQTGLSDAADVGPSVTTRFYTPESTNPSDPIELAVGDGHVFTTELLDDVSGRSRLVAYDEESGEQVWEHVPPSRGDDATPSGVGRVLDAPVVSDGTVIVASDELNNDGEWEYGGVFAFDTQTGALEWTNQGNYHWRNPLVADGTLVAQNLENNNVNAFDAESGEQLWSCQTDLTTTTLFAVRNETVYARLDGPDSRYIVGLSVADGSVRWRHELPADVAAAQRPGNAPDAAVDGEAIYYATQTEDENALVAQSLADGSVKWNCSLTRSCGDPRDTLSELVVADGSVYAFTTVDSSADAAISASLWSVDAASGTREWVWTSPYPLYGSPTATDGHVYLGTEAPLTEDASGRYYDVAPISEYPTVVAVDTADGEVSWAYAEPPESGGEDELFARTPVVTDHGIYVKATGDDRDSSTRVLSLAATDDEIGPNHRPKRL